MVKAGRRLREEKDKAREMFISCASSLIYCGLAATPLMHCSLCNAARFDSAVSAFA